MAGVNKVIIVGNLGQDPEVRFMTNGDPVANITVATSESWKDKQTGEQKDKTEWHRVVIFGKLAEITGQYLKKGSKVYLEGKLQTRKWTNQQGQDQYTTEIVLQGYNGVMHMLDGKQQGQQQGSYQQQAPAQGGFQQQAPVPQQGNFNQQQQWPPTNGGQQHQAPKVNPQEPSIDYDDQIPF